MMSSAIRGESYPGILEMDSVEKWHKRRAAVERWKNNHRERYLAQKRVLAHRPEYLAHRRAMYKMKRSTTRSENLSTEKQYEFEKIHTRSDHCLDRRPDRATSPEERGGSRVA
jgi:hypothetical protein